MEGYLLSKGWRDELQERIKFFLLLKSSSCLEEKISNFFLKSWCDMDILHYGVSDIQSLIEGGRPSSDDLHKHCHLSDYVGDNQISHKHHYSDIELLDISCGEELVTSNDHN